MKTAIELAARLSARYLDTKQMLQDELAHESAAMLLQQAEQIEALKADLRRAKNDLADALDYKNGMGPTALGTVLKERDALKADAERYKGNTMTKQYQHWCKQCQRDTRNGHTPFCPATGVTS